MAALEPVAPSIWAVAAPQKFLGLHVGTRMTVVKLRNGGLLLHSPVPLTSELKAALDALGPVQHIVCPNDFHHLYAGEAKAAYPQALLHGPATLRKKRKDLAFDAELTQTPHPDWQGDLELLTIAGCMLNETVFYHPATRTLIAVDLVENFKQMPHAPTRLYLKASGIFGKPGWGRFMRFVYRDRPAARACLDQMLQWPFERLVPAHGEILASDAREAVRRGLAWVN